MSKTIAILIFGSLAIMGCDRNYDGEDSNAATYRPDTESEVMVPEAEWQSFKRETELQIDANQAKLRELRNTLATKYADSIAALEERNELLRRQLRVYTYDDEGKWNSFRDGFNHDIQELEDAIDGVYSKTKK